jgi:hypothetical protein
MAIHLPESCRGVTSGALRQVKINGHTSASGGLFAAGYVRGMLTTASLSSYASKNEPLGKFMETISETEKSIKGVSEAIRTQVSSMVAAADAANIQMTDLSRKLRDSTDKFGTALARFSATTSDPRFAEKVKQAESLVDSLERLAKLQETGMLDKVIAAMAGK